MDIAETMKNVLAKNLQQTSVNDVTNQSNLGFPGYVTEKLYMLLQLYLQNKGWNPSVELLQCFTELKDSAMLPSAAYLQMMASRVALDTQGRLVLRENGKIILPYEHFANAVMLKHMAGPHGLHLGLEATVRAVMDSYTIGREHFGMEKEFIVEVVQNCPNAACRYYKNQMDLTQKTIQHLTAPTYISESQSNNAEQFPMPIPPPGMNAHLGLGPVDLTGQPNVDAKSSQQPLLERPKSVAPSQQQITAAIIQQQNRVIAQQNLEKLNANLEKQRQQAVQQLHQQMDLNKAAAVQQQQAKNQHFELPVMDHKLTDFLRANLENLEGLSSANKDLLALHNGAWAPGANGGAGGNAGVTTGSLEDKHSNTISESGQEKIIRAFAEVMKNMARMKTYVRPSMCKPYGKQSEALQKTLVDTIQLVQSLRSFLPPPHIQVSSWKNEDKHRSIKTAASMDEICEPRKVE